MRDSAIEAFGGGCGPAWVEGESAPRHDLMVEGCLGGPCLTSLSRGNRHINKRRLMDFMTAKNINASQPIWPETITMSYCVPGDWYTSNRGMHTYKGRADANGNVVLHRMPDGDDAVS